MEAAAAESTGLEEDAEVGSTKVLKGSAQPSFHRIRGRSGCPNNGDKLQFTGN
ncbi:hypothetical protein KBY66_05145 [Synechococcus sp. Tobar12-5m-g]|jgi:hypothetical protein|uniref:hypothetical protein n=1 Tax=unclassified Synechococcus TaxID=2626047 RepID=UPI0020CEB01C|nr:MULTISPECIES: hypothetical protein [unclassified Synechococcus]MCP9772011.1 hypothetical protein [Synechococcus sp. Tobar12-5m-g]MCP9872953.1 hypothetical protein [Synechococcus sp. Cruz CV-v-12]